MSKCGVISGPYFPVFGLNAGKYGPEIPSYLDISRSAIIIVSALPLDRGETEFFKKVPKREGLELGIFQFTGTGDRKKRT